MPSIYIAGPMTGYPEFNFPAFDAARDYLERDWNVISPASVSTIKGTEYQFIEGRWIATGERLYSQAAFTRALTIGAPSK